MYYFSVLPAISNRDREEERDWRGVYGVEKKRRRSGGSATRMEEKKLI